MLAQSLHVLAQVHPSLTGSPADFCASSARTHSAQQHAGARCKEHGPAQRRRWASSQLFALGGRDSSWRGIAACAAYNAFEDVWVPGPQLPRHEPFARAVGCDGRVCAFGNGSRPCCLNSTAPVEEWRWQHTCETHFPGDRLCMEAAAVGRDMWLLGGRVLPNTVRAVLVTGSAMRANLNDVL